jgi:hypothetical protein
MCLHAEHPGNGTHSKLTIVTLDSRDRFKIFIRSYDPDRGENIDVGVLEHRKNCDLLKIFRCRVVFLNQKRISSLKGHSAIPNPGSKTMKKFTAIMMGIFFVGAIALMCNTYAVAAPPGHPGHHGGHGHHKHHGPHWGYGSGIIVGSSPVIVDDGCYMVKKCYVNEFGQRWCRWRQVCD